MVWSTYRGRTPSSSNQPRRSAADPLPSGASSGTHPLVVVRIRRRARVGRARRRYRRRAIGTYSERGMAGTTQIRILLADQQALFREALRTGLESEHDLNVVGEARSGPEAVVEAERTSPDVAILDIGLPVM